MIPDAVAAQIYARSWLRILTNDTGEGTILFVVWDAERERQQRLNP